MNKFKVGDRVSVAAEYRDKCIRLRKEGWAYLRISGVRTDGLHEYEGYDANNKPVGRCWECYEKYLVPLAVGTKGSEVAFILQYELDEDPFETFATMKEVEARIKELAKRPDLKRESIKVYEVAKTYDVSLETKVKFGGLKPEKEAKPAARKRGRPSTRNCPNCPFKGKNKRSLGAHRRFNHA